MQSDKSLIDNELFVISVFVVGVPLLLTVFLSKDYNNILEFLKYTLPFAILEVLGAIATICILTYLILKIFHLVQYLLVRKRMAHLKQKEEVMKQNQKDNLNVLRREMQKLFLEAKPLLNAENTKENKQKLEKILDKLLQSKYNNLALYDERLKYIKLIRNKVEQICDYLQSKEKEILEKKEQIKKNLEIGKGYFKKANLKDDQIQVLLEEGFSEEKCVGLDDKSTYSYLLKPRANESVQHFFLTMIVADYIKSLGINVETPNSRDADIIFEINGVKWAIEVETGSYPQKSPDEFEEKIKILNEKYSSNLIILVTDRSLIPKYRKYFAEVYHRHKIKDKINEVIKTSSLNIEKIS